MDREEFEQIIRKGLADTTLELKRKFAWQSAVLALPIIGYKGNFNFWPEKKRQHYLYSIFWALDISVAADVAATIANAATAATAAIAANAAADDTAATAATAAAATAATAAGTFIDDDAYADAADEAAAAAAYSATAAAIATNIANARVGMSINMQTILLNYLRDLKTDKTSHPNISFQDYGPIWENFQNALAAEGCSYWGKLYQKIFENGFILDREALALRLNVPHSIREQGAAVVGQFLTEKELKGVEKLNEARIIILGDKGAGKTCIARRLINPDADMTTDDESTAGVDTKLWKLEKENVNVRIWDFAGHVVTHAVHKFFLSERCVYIIVHNGRTEEPSRLEYWLNHMKNYGGDSRAFILVNERDQHSVAIPENTLREKYAIQDVHCFSVKKNRKQLEQFRDEVAAFITKNPAWDNQTIPASYYRTKKRLEALFEKENGEKCTDYISKSDFDTIASECDASDNAGLLSSLHALGVSLWYSDMEKFNMLVLNPEWISHGVYTLINWANEQKKHALTFADFREVFGDEKGCKRYPEKRYEFLFELMKHYQLAYETREGGTLIIPHLLNEDRPKVLPEFPVGEGLMLQYKSEQSLPPHTISQFIVRHNEQIKEEKGKYMVWRYGVVLQDGKGSIALVREENRTISVAVKGNEKTAFIGTLRETLNDIFRSYKSEKPELQYRVERFGQIPEEVENKNPLWLSDNKIFNHVQDNEPYYEETTRSKFFLDKIKDAYNINIENLMIGNQGGIKIDRSIKKINFSNCNFDLQGALRELSGLLEQSGKPNEAVECRGAADALIPVEESTDKKEVKRSGALNGARRIVEQLSDETSLLNQTVKGVKTGATIVKDILKAYGEIRGWMG